MPGTASGSVPMISIIKVLLFYHGLTLPSNILLLFYILFVPGLIFLDSFLLAHIWEKPGELQLDLHFTILIKINSYDIFLNI